MYFMQIFFHLLSSANKFTDLFVFPNFLFTLHEVYEVTLENLRSNECFEYKSK